MRLIDALPKDAEGNIVLPVAGYIDGVPVEGFVVPTWMETNIPDLANASVPLSDENLAALKAIGYAWSDSADIWRQQGLI